MPCVQHHVMTIQRTWTRRRLIILHYGDVKASHRMRWTCRDRSAAERHSSSSFEALEASG